MSFPPSRRCLASPMPLPKSCSVAARATEAYAEAWSVVLHECWGVKPPRDEPLPPLTQLLPFIRQLLTCCACAGLLEEAMISGSCGHCYCAKCQTGTPLLKIQCRQCKERTGLVAENQIRLVVKCYRHMCHVLADYLTTTPSAPLRTGEFTLAKGREIPEGFNPITEILAEVVEQVKVSRTVLLVLPPPKYLNPKPPPDPPTPRKDPQTSPGVGHKDSATQSAEDEDNIVNAKPIHLPLDTATYSPSRSHKKKREKRKKLKLDNRKRHRKKPSLHVPPSLKLKIGIHTAQFHSDVEFTAVRPKSSSCGEMKLFVYQRFLRLKQTALCGPDTDPDIQVSEDCFDRDYIFSSDSIYKVRSDLPSSLLPHLSNFSSLLKSKDCDRKVGTSKRDIRAAVLHSRSALAPRATFRLLRPKYKSPYLHNSLDAQQKKPRQTPSAPSELKTPKITLTPCGSGTPSEGAPIKKKKRGPMTPGHWRCRCGTNNPQTFDRICARGKCPCFVKNIPCINCLCRHCKNPFNISHKL